MPVITLPDQTKKEFAEVITVADVAASIGAGLAKAALAGVVNGKLVDTFYTIENDADLRIITDRDPEGLDIIRHSTAHLLAHAVKSLFPEAEVTIGPVIENGFYYDFAYANSFSENDLLAIEEKMLALAQADFVVSRTVMSRDAAISFFEKLNEHYKVEIIKDIPATETLTIYQQGDFADLCRGPHVPRTGMLKAFKLIKVSGAYWRGDAKNAMLQRIYGTAWRDKKALETYLHNLAEAEKRDHRKLAKSMDLYHIQEEAPGMIFWHPNGWSMYQKMKNYISQKVTEQGYEEVVTPQLVDIELWKKSGHYDMFKDDMFIVETDSHQYAVKPMNCPCHVQLFKQGLKSYRDLPLRYAEFGCVHRNEMTGAMHGLMRVRQLTQDDAHIFCTEAQIESESIKFIQLVFDVYHDFGFHDINIRLATRPEKRIGTESSWDKAEEALANALHKSNLDFTTVAGEGGFYGPKIEFHLQDCLGRSWQCGTLQVDYNQPERLEASYIGEDGARKTPVMLHRAILGSLERFMGILIEQHAGKMPLWLSPIQVVVMNITDKQSIYVTEIVKKLQKHGLSVKSDLRNEKIGFKIREHTLAHIPYLLVIGDREVESQSVAVRTQDGMDLGVMALDELISRLTTEIADKRAHDKSGTQIGGRQD